MIDYSKTQNTLQALCLQFPKLTKDFIRSKIGKYTKEIKLVEYLTDRNNPF
jgi:hypothetical protein